MTDGSAPYWCFYRATYPNVKASHPDWNKVQLQREVGLQWFHIRYNHDRHAEYLTSKERGMREARTRKRKRDTTALRDLRKTYTTPDAANATIRGATPLQRTIHAMYTPPPKTNDRPVRYGNEGVFQAWKNNYDKELITRRKIRRKARSEFEALLRLGANVDAQTLEAAQTLKRNPDHTILAKLGRQLIIETSGVPTEVADLILDFAGKIQPRPCFCFGSVDPPTI